MTYRIKDRLIYPPNQDKKGDRRDLGTGTGD